jgi:hypothetical protein
MARIWNHRLLNHVLHDIGSDEILSGKSGADMEDRV